MNNQPAPPALLRETWPVFAAELATALDAYGEDRLTIQVDQLHIVDVCACTDDLCQSFYTGPKPAGAYGPGHCNVCLEPPWPGYLISTCCTTTSCTSRFSIERP